MPSQEAKEVLQSRGNWGKKAVSSPIGKWVTNEQGLLVAGLERLNGYGEVLQEEVCLRKV